MEGVRWTSVFKGEEMKKMRKRQGVKAQARGGMGESQGDWNMGSSAGTRSSPLFS